MEETKLRKTENRHLIDRLSRLIAEHASEIFERHDYYQSCITCISWSESAEVCRRYSNARPPAHIIARGCASYDDSRDIPF